MLRAVASVCGASKIILCVYIREKKRLVVKGPYARGNNIIAGLSGRTLFNTDEATLI